MLRQLKNGDELATYRLERRLGEGAFAEVWLATEEGAYGFRKQVALKVLKEERATDEHFKSLVHEARVCGYLHHPHVVDVYGVAEASGLRFIAMEFVDGVAMDRLLASCAEAGLAMPPSIILDIGVQIAQALDHAHRATDDTGKPLNLVHRDLKPANVMVGRSADVKIMDFGVAKAESNLYKTTLADTVKGTPIYMSPEQASAELLDRRSDLFSLGILLYELVTLELPFQGDSIGQIMNAILGSDLDEVIERAAEHDEAFCPLLESLLARKPDDRPATAGAVMLALAELELTLPPGPTLRAWLKEVEEDLPAARPMGDFGRDGPPESPGLVEVAYRPPAIPSPRSDTVILPRDSRSRGLPPEPSPEPPATPDRPRRTGPILGIVAMVVILAGCVAAWIWLQRAAPEAGEERVQVQQEASPEPAEGSPEAVVETPEATPEIEEATVEPPLPSPVPAVAVDIRPTVTPTPAPVATPAPPPPAPPGTVSFNSSPWSTVYVDGKELGATPLHDVRLAAGEHTVRFICSGCSSEQERAYEFTVEPGADTSELVRF